MPTKRFNPVGARISVLAVWAIISAIPLTCSLVFNFHGNAHAVFVVVTALISVALAAIGIPKCMKLSLVFFDTGIWYANMFRRGTYEWQDVSEITLRRYESTVAVDEQLTAQMPRGLVPGMRPPAVALRLRSGGLSPPLTITAFLGSKNRTQLVGLLREYSAPYGVTVRINDGGRSWNMRLSKGPS